MTTQDTCDIGNDAASIARYVRNLTSDNAELGEEVALKALVLGCRRLAKTGAYILREEYGVKRIA